MKGERENLAPGGYLAKSAEIFCGHNWGKGTSDELLHILQFTGEPLEQRIIQLKVSLMPKENTTIDHLLSVC